MGILRFGWCVVAASLAFPMAGADTAPAAPPVTEVEVDGATSPWPLGVGIGRDELGAIRATGPGFEASFGPAGMAYQPGLGRNAPRAEGLVLSARRLVRGAAALELGETEPALAGGRVSYQRAPGVEERFDLLADGLEHSLFVEQPFGTAGDLVVHVDVSGSLAPFGQRQPDGSHLFDGGFGGVHYGTLTGIDATGRSTSGDVRLVEGGLEWVLPASFVDVATWPILLDPVVGAATTILADIPGPGMDSQTDIAYDATNNRYLAVWIQPVSSGMGLVRAQRLNTSGVPVGSVINISEVDTSRRVKVANVNGSNRFAVVWLQDFFGETQVRLRLVSAADGSLSSNLYVEGAPEGSILGADVVGESNSAVAAQAWVVWDSSTGGIRGARVAVPSGSAAPSVSAEFSVAADPGTFDRLEYPSLSAAPSAGGQLAVTWVRRNALADSTRIYAATFNRVGTIVQAATLVSGSATDVVRPAIDGGGPSSAPEWTLVWSGDGVSGGLLFARSWRPTVSPALGDLRSFVGVGSPRVAWRTGISIMANDTGSGGSFGLSNTSVRHVGLNPSDCTVCQVSGAAIESASLSGTILQSGPAVGGVALALASAGGSASNSGGMVLYTLSQIASAGLVLKHSIKARPIDAFAASAGSTDLGGSCAGAGNLEVLGKPGIGNLAFGLRLNSAPPGALFAWLNLSTATATFDCGACKWLPFQTVIPAPISGGSSTVALGLPCLPSLAGLNLDSQFTVLLPGAGACAFGPDFGVTQIVRLAIR